MTAAWSARYVMCFLYKIIALYKYLCIIITITIVAAESCCCYAPKEIQTRFSRQYLYLIFFLFPNCYYENIKNEKELNLVAVSFEAIRADVNRI